MRNIKIITVAFFIGLLCLNAECNKVEEIPPVNEFFILEGKLINSCTDNSPKKNWNFICYEENNYLGRLEVKTDSNGYFRIYSKFNGKNIILKEDGGKILLYKIPGGKSINFGEIAYNFSVVLKIKAKNFNKTSASDSIFIDFSGYSISNPYKYLILKGPFPSEELAIAYPKESMIYDNKDSLKGYVQFMKFSKPDLIQKKTYTFLPCGTTQEVIFEF